MIVVLEFLEGGDDDDDEEEEGRILGAWLGASVGGMKEPGLLLLLLVTVA
jgi:hypothetical protein